MDFRSSKRGFSTICVTVFGWTDGISVTTTGVAQEVLQFVHCESLRLSPLGGGEIREDSYLLSFPWSLIKMKKSFRSRKSLIKKKRK